MVFTTEGFLEVPIESWPEWNLNPRPYIETYTYTFHPLLIYFMQLLIPHFHESQSNIFTQHTSFPYTITLKISISKNQPEPSKF